jgi:hypothetical protein
MRCIVLNFHRPSRALKQSSSAQNCDSRFFHGARGRLRCRRRMR